MSDVQSNLNVHKNNHFIKCMQRAGLRDFTSCRSRLYHSAPLITWTVFIMSLSAVSLSVVLRGILCQMSGGLCSHVARERLILCAHSACRQSAGHNSSERYSTTTHTHTHTVSPSSQQAALALAGTLTIGQGLISADTSFHFAVQLKLSVFCAKIQNHLIGQLAK